MVSIEVFIVILISEELISMLVFIFNLSFFKVWQWNIQGPHWQFVDAKLSYTHVPIVMSSLGIIISTFLMWGFWKWVGNYVC